MKDRRWVLLLFVLLYKAGVGWEVVGKRTGMGMGMGGGGGEEEGRSGSI